jgi:hypothetical protein
MAFVLWALRKLSPRLEGTQHSFILAASIFFSLGGVGAAAFYFHDPMQGGRGGALAVMVSFFSLFVSRNFGRRIHAALVELPRMNAQILSQLRHVSTVPSSIPIGHLSDELERLTSETRATGQRIDAHARSQRRQNLYIAWSSGIGTFFWGFGDIVASRIMAGSTPSPLVVHITLFEPW